MSRHIKVHILFNYPKLIGLYTCNVFKNYYLNLILFFNLFNKKNLSKFFKEYEF